jgi:hypothetical protein
MDLKAKKSQLEKAKSFINAGSTGVSKSAASNLVSNDKPGTKISAKKAVETSENESPGKKTFSAYISLSDIESIQTRAAKRGVRPCELISEFAKYCEKSSVSVLDFVKEGGS